MKLAVAIPCYNGAPFIARCVESVLSQTIPPNEIIVVDDGSSDDSVDIISEYPVRILRHGENKGLAAGRNTALGSTDADVLVYVDVDAFADREMLAQLRDGFKNERIAGVGGQGVEIIEKNIYDRWRKLHASQTHGSRYKDSVSHLFGLCMAYQTKVLREVNGFDSRFLTNAEDVDIGYRINKAGYRLVYNPSAKVFHQRQDDRASLLQMMHQWYYWGFVAKWKNGRNPWSLLFGTLKRLFLTDTLPDLLLERNPDLARLDLEIAKIKIYALCQAAKDIKIES